MIVDYSIGHTSSIHNSWAFWSTCTCKEHECIFGPDEWMWADPAYPSETWSVLPFKKPAKCELSPDQKTFNYHLSKICICVEHAIGLLKGRFQSLFELQIQIYMHKKHLWAVMWIQCCIILHNLVLQIEAGKDDRSGERNSTISGINRREPNTDTGGRKLRQKVKMTWMHLNLLIIVSWLLARNFNEGLWKSYLIAKWAEPYIVCNALWFWDYIMTWMIKCQQNMNECQ